jgi:predicted glycosyltransferase
MNATRIMVYSHDTFGLGNLRRIIAICEHLLNYWPQLSILLVSGSPMIHEFRLPKGLDYIKLPCLNRGISGELSVKHLGTSMEETVALRSQLIHSAATHFKPDLLLIDKKPTGIKGELIPTLDYLQQNLPKSKSILLLRDILDTPEKTVAEWDRFGYYSAIQAHYDQIWVVGMHAVFDVAQAYRLPLPIAHKVRYCGYIRKQLDNRKRADVKAQLGINRSERLVLVTPGGGEDGYKLIETYLEGCLQAEKRISDPQNRHLINNKEIFHSLILCGPEMPVEQYLKLQQLAERCPRITLKSFTNDLLSHIKAADAVVSMGGYNTLTEIIAMGKRTVVVPRIKPSQEQLIRATCFAKKGWVTMIHPERVTARSLIQAVIAQFDAPPPPSDELDFNGLPQIARHLAALLRPHQQPALPISPLRLMA